MAMHDLPSLPLDGDHDAKSQVDENEKAARRCLDKSRAYPRPDGAERAYVAVAADLRDSVVVVTPPLVSVRIFPAAS